MNELEEMDARNAELCEYFSKNYNLHVLSYSEEEPQNVLSLNLTNTGITCLESQVLGRTSNLESIDLSNNLLSDLSNLSDIDLPNLTKLDLKYNQISNFSFLTNLKSLQDLDIRGNQFDSSLIYWTVCQLPQLKRINGEDVSEIRNYLSMVQLQAISCIDTVFSNEFEVSLKKTESGISQMKTALNNLLINKCGIIEEAQLALKDQIEHLVSNKLNDLITNILSKFNSNHCFSNNITIKLNGRPESVGSSHPTVTEILTQLGDNESDILSKAIEEAIGELNVEIKPFVAINTQISNNKFPLNKSIKRQKSEESLNLNENTLKQKPLSNERQNEKNQRNSGSFPLSYKMTKILRKQTKPNCPGITESKVSIWDIKFRPIGRNYRGCHLVVTCGVNIVNIIDLKTETVVKRYEDTNASEIFNCVVWTDFIVNTAKGGTRDLSLICVGGTKKDKKLTNILFLNADDMTDFFKIRGHSQSVNCLVFHPTKRNVLFSGSYDRKVMVWRLDSGKMTELSKLSSLSVRKSMEIDCNNRILSSIFVKNLDILVVSGEDGIVLIKSSNDSTDKKKNSVLTYKVDIPTKKPVIDGLVPVGSDSDWIAFRLKEFIFVADLKKMIESANDQKVVPLLVVSRLRYCPQKCDYFYMSIESRLLCCGSADGQILLYYLKDSILKSQQKENLLEPIRVLPKPEINKFCSNNEKLLKSKSELFFVNIAAISPNHEYIVSGTNNNMICIWKRFRSHQTLTQSSHPSNKKLKTLQTI